MGRYFRKLAIPFLALTIMALPAAGYARGGGNGPSAQAATASAAASLATPHGLWITANGDAVIQIAACGNGLCGYIVGMFLGPKDPTPKDWAGTSQCRLTIIQAAAATDSSGQPHWTGHITDPRNGNAYNATIRVDAQNELLLRGYIGLPIFGETQTWTPYHGSLAQNCRLPQPQLG
jgi:uncharacterized protein (DUF2147 family)